MSELLHDAHSWDGHDLNVLERFLFDHALIEIQCDHETKLDRALCACSVVDLGWYPSVGEARQSWVDHVMRFIRGKPSVEASLRLAKAQRPLVEVDAIGELWNARHLKATGRLP